MLSNSSGVGLSGSRPADGSAASKGSKQGQGGMPLGPTMDQSSSVIPLVLDAVISPHPSGTDKLVRLTLRTSPGKTMLASLSSGYVVTPSSYDVMGSPLHPLFGDSPFRKIGPVSPSFYSTEPTPVSGAASWHPAGNHLSPGHLQPPTTFHMTLASANSSSSGLREQVPSRQLVLKKTSNPAEDFQKLKGEASRQERMRQRGRQLRKSQSEDSAERPCSGAGVVVESPYSDVWPQLAPEGAEEGASFRDMLQTGLPSGSPIMGVPRMGDPVWVSHHLGHPDDGFLSLHIGDLAQDASSMATEEASRKPRIPTPSKSAFDEFQVHHQPPGASAFPGESHPGYRGGLLHEQLIPARPELESSRSELSASVARHTLATSALKPTWEQKRSSMLGSKLGSRAFLRAVSENDTLLKAVSFRPETGFEEEVHTWLVGDGNREAGGEQHDGDNGDDNREKEDGGHQTGIGGRSHSAPRPSLDREGEKDFPDQAPRGGIRSAMASPESSWEAKRRVVLGSRHGSKNWTRTQAGSQAGIPIGSRLKTMGEDSVITTAQSHLDPGLEAEVQKGGPGRCFFPRRAVSLPPLTWEQKREAMLGSKNGSKNWTRVNRILKTEEGKALERRETEEQQKWTRVNRSLQDEDDTPETAGAAISTCADVTLMSQANLPDRSEVSTPDLWREHRGLVLPQGIPATRHPLGGSKGSHGRRQGHSGPLPLRSKVGPA